jgi:hypothetical protein
VRTLIEEMTKHGKIGVSAMKADMDRKTARRYVAAGKLPSEMKARRGWRTGEDPFAGHWSEVESLVRETPALDAKTLFEQLCEKYPERYEPGQLRTLQRRDSFIASASHAACPAAVCVRPRNRHGWSGGRALALRSLRERGRNVLFANAIFPAADLLRGR